MCVRILFVLGMLAICEATPVLASEFAAEGQDARHSSNHCGNQILRNNRFAAAAFAPPNASDSAVPENGAVLCQPGQPQARKKQNVKMKPRTHTLVTSNQ